MNDTARQIVETAIGMMCRGGYHAFSFRQIATELDIKSASIHYYFPSKSDLGSAAMRVYCDNFSTQLAALEKSPQPLAEYLKMFEKSLKRTKSGCLAGILASECGELPQELKDEVEVFRNRNLDWLQETLLAEQTDWTEKEAKAAAAMVFSSLQGALAFSAVSRDPKHLQRVTQALESFVLADREVLLSQRAS